MSIFYHITTDYGVRGNGLQVAQNLFVRDPPR